MLSLSERMKRYEACTAGSLPVNTPIILRVDGRAFHTLTKIFERPYDDVFASLMNAVGAALCKEISNARLAYLQSDEVSVLIYNDIESDVWFGNNIQKMTSISASLATSVFNRLASGTHPHIRDVTFDSRVFAVPEKDVCNYFIWRQRDWERNSLHMACRSVYSQADLQGVNTSGMHELLFKKGINWSKLEQKWKRGRCIIKVPTPDLPIKFKWTLDEFIPIFTQNREYIESRLRGNENV